MPRKTAATKPPAGKIIVPGDEVRRFREALPKTMAEVAAGACVDERTILNLEHNRPVSFRTLEKAAKGLGINYQSLLALARGEITTLNQVTHQARFRVTITIEGEAEEKAAKEYREFLKELAVFINARYPLGDRVEITKGSVRLSFRIYIADVQRLYNWFISGAPGLKRLGIRELSIMRPQKTLRVLAILPKSIKKEQLPDSENVNYVRVNTTSRHTVSLMADPWLDAIVVDTSMIDSAADFSEAEFPIELAAANSRGTPILVVTGSNKAIHPLYDAFPAVASLGEIESKLLQWFDTSWRRKRRKNQENRPFGDDEERNMY